MSDQQTIDDSAAFWVGFVADVQSLLTRIASLPSSTPVQAIDFTSLTRAMDTASSLRPEINATATGTAPQTPVAVATTTPATETVSPLQAAVTAIQDPPVDPGAIPIASMNATAGGAA